jgi:hypothetical protein
MTTIFSSHRAGWGLAAIAAMALFFVQPSGWPESEAGFWLSRALLAALWLAGQVAIAGSPYWKIFYREAPLKRAITGVSDLDERELALRDRANGLTYYLLVVLSLLLLLGAGAAADIGWVELSGDTLIRAILPYALLALTLPVIMLEWFEPSGDRPAPADEED